MIWRFCFSTGSLFFPLTETPILKKRQLMRIAARFCSLPLMCFSSLSPITFANILGPDQARQNVGPDLHPICLTLFLKYFFEKVDFQKKKKQNTESMNNFSGG